MKAMDLIRAGSGRATVVLSGFRKDRLAWGQKGMIAEVSVTAETETMVFLYFDYMKAFDFNLGILRQDGLDAELHHDEFWFRKDEDVPVEIKDDCGLLTEFLASDSQDYVSWLEQRLLAARGQKQ